MKSQRLFTSDVDGEPTAVQIRTVAARGGVVVLCCHGQDRVDLELAANRLQDRGCLIEIVSTIDMDSGALSSAIDHHGDSARFVFCATPRFGPRSIVKYRQFLLSYGVNDHSILTFEFDENNPNDLIENIIQALSKRAVAQALKPSRLLSFFKRIAKTLAPNHIMLIGGIVSLMLLAGLSLIYFYGNEASVSTEKKASAPLLAETTAERTNRLNPEIPSAKGEQLIEEQRIIKTLIRKKLIRSLDNILVVQSRADTMGFVQAQATCRSMSLGSVVGWRLPSLGELRSISMAQLAPQGTLWSSTPADIVGESFFTWSTENNASLAYDDKWENGLVICVRPRLIEGTAEDVSQ